ncbi:hypothetical protein FQN54_005953, partial [Arachnomyces sp. PD_36]
IFTTSGLLVLSLPYIAVESPRRSVLNGDLKTALRTLYKTRPSRLIAARDFYRIHVASISKSKPQQPQNIATLSACLANPTLRRATISSVIIMLTRVLIIPFELVLQAAEPSSSSDTQLIVGLLLSVRGLVFTYFLNALIDRIRRRRLLLGFIVFGAMDISAICTTYAVEVLPSAYRGMTALFPYDVPGKTALFGEDQLTVKRAQNLASQSR